MKRFSSVLAIFIGIILASLAIQPAQAHVLETDNGVSAVLHIPPDDIPLAGKAVTADFAFISADPAFNVKNYQIEARLLRGDDTVASASVQPIDDLRLGASTTLTFPERGAYRLAVQGKARDPKLQPQDFELIFSVRAIRPGGDEPNAWQAAGSDFWILSAGSLAVLILIARYNIRQGKRYS